MKTAILLFSLLIGCGQTWEEADLCWHGETACIDDTKIGQCNDGENLDFIVDCALTNKKCYENPSNDYMAECINE